MYGPTQTPLGIPHIIHLVNQRVQIYANRFCKNIKPQMEPSKSIFNRNRTQKQDRNGTQQNHVQSK